MELAEIYNHSLIPELLECHPFDITAGSGSQQFKRTIRNMISILMLREVNPHLLYKIVRIIRRDIKNVLENFSSRRYSDIIRNLLEIVTALLEAVVYIRNNSNSPEFLDEIKSEEKSLKKILEKMETIRK